MLAGQRQVVFGVKVRRSAGWPPDHHRGTRTPVRPHARTDARTHEQMHARTSAPRTNTRTGGCSCDDRHRSRLSVDAPLVKVNVVRVEVVTGAKSTCGAVRCGAVRRGEQAMQSSRTDDAPMRSRRSSQAASHERRMGKAQPTNQATNPPTNYPTSQPAEKPTDRPTDLISLDFPAQALNVSSCFLGWLMYALMYEKFPNSWMRSRASV